jgi:hypothetical protein
MTFDEVTNEESLDISGRLVRAQWHFEELRDEARRAKAQRLGETFGGMQERVTRYDLDEAERFLTRHGFGRDATTPSISAADEWQDEWTSVNDALLTIPEGVDSVKVSVKFATDETPIDAFYLRQVGTLSTPGFWLCASGSDS